MKIFIFITFLFFVLLGISCDSEWGFVWLEPSTILSQSDDAIKVEVDCVSKSAVYPSLGTTSATANPGSRAYGSGFVAGSFFYIFGGLSNRGLLGDTWKKQLPTSASAGKFNWVNNAWYWIGGSSSADYVGTGSEPAARYSFGYSDIDSTRMIIYGGIVATSDGRKYMNDVWSYDSSTNQWQNHIAGAANTERTVSEPGSRSASSMILANGKIYLYGGYAKTSENGGNYGYEGDLWSMDTSSLGTWTSVNTGCTRSAEGCLAVYTTSATPGGRGSAQLWTDDTSIFIFGGITENSNGGELKNSLFRYVISGDSYSVLSGSSSSTGVEDDTQGIYADYDEFSDTAIPLGRANSIGFMTTDGSNNYLNVFSGEGLQLANDLWTYGVIESKWKVHSNNKGGYDDTDAFRSSYYSNLQSYYELNVPADRAGAIQFTYAIGAEQPRYYFFGGESGEGPGFLNDFWLAFNLEDEQNFFCNSISRFNYSVCNSNGICVGSNTCECYERYDPDTFCETVLPEEPDRTAFYISLPISILFTIFNILLVIGTICFGVFVFYLEINGKLTPPDPDDLIEGVDLNLEDFGDDDEEEEEKPKKKKKKKKTGKGKKKKKKKKKQEKEKKEKEKRKKRKEKVKNQQEKEKRKRKKKKKKPKPKVESEDDDSDFEDAVEF